MAYRRTVTLVAVPFAAIVCLGSGVAQGANPTYYDDLMEFQTDVTFTVTDDYQNGGYVFNQSDVQMSAVLGETDYESTGHMNTNLITGMGDFNYCAGCNGSFQLSFLTTTVGNAEGVNGVGVQIVSHDIMGLPYYAFITFADGTTADIPLPPAGNFWGVSAPERIEQIHFGLSMGVATTNGYFEIDDLIVGDGFDMTPCGDGIVHDDEECDDMGASAECDADCTPAECGDGTLNEVAGEVCDAGGESPFCNSDCTEPYCGDGLVNIAIGEDCDEGGGETATCNADCTVPECGDDIVNVLAGEACDDGGQSSACDGDCTLVECGDGVENNLAGEYCDDGNLVDGDGCSATCTNEEVETEGGDESSSDGGTSGSGETTGTTASTDEAGETGVDPSAGEGAVDESGSGSEGATDPDPTTLTATNAADESSSSGGSGAANDDVSGCGCTTSDDHEGRGALWSVMLLLGAGALGRRRREGR